MFSICDFGKVKDLSCRELVPAEEGSSRDWFRETNLPGSVLTCELVDVEP